jgi:nitroimidazol reductase NimA-like FMN-containing flavoprotein (pyridoxamine 5'-phosphate oxidase superfamily)
MAPLRELSEAECVQLLATTTVGRVAVSTPEGPRVLPVSYALVQGSVVFRTSPFSILGTYAWGNPIAFEIDHVDDERRVGWSVMATGPAELVDEEAEIAAIQAMADPSPWADGDRMLYIRLRWERLSGRSLDRDAAATGADLAR